MAPLHRIRATPQTITLPPGYVSRETLRTAHGNPLLNRCDGANCGGGGQGHEGATRARRRQTGLAAAE
eukprot:1592064-Prymnesium_polylepis.1